MPISLDAHIIEYRFVAADFRGFANGQEWETFGQYLAQRDVPPDWMTAEDGSTPEDAMAARQAAFAEVLAAERDAHLNARHHPPCTVVDGQWTCVRRAALALSYTRTPERPLLIRVRLV